MFAGKTFEPWIERGWLGEKRDSFGNKTTKELCQPKIEGAGFEPSARWAQIITAATSLESLCIGGHRAKEVPGASAYWSKAT